MLSLTLFAITTRERANPTVCTQMRVNMERPLAEVLDAPTWNHMNQNATRRLHLSSVGRYVKNAPDIMQTTLLAVIVMTRTTDGGPTSVVIQDTEVVGSILFLYRIQTHLYSSVSLDSHMNIVR